MNLLLEAYELNYEFRTNKIAKIIISEKDLQKFLGYLFRRKILRSLPHKSGEKYEIYVLGFIDDKNIYKEYPGVKIKHINLGELSKNIKDEIAYIAFRQNLYESGFKQSSSSKIYDPKAVLGGNGILKVYKAIVTGFETINGKSHLLIDAGRKAEFSDTIDKLKRDFSDKINSLYWIKIHGSTTSFTIDKSVHLSHFKKTMDEVIEKSKEVLTYLYKIGRIRSDLLQISYDENNLFEYGLRPKSLKLRYEFRREGILLDVKGSEGVLFLPEHILLPVASTENIKLFVSDITEIYETFKISPDKRHAEITSFLEKFNNLKTDELTITVSQEPLRSQIFKAEAYSLYLKNGSGSKNLISSVTKWNPYAKLKQYAKNITFCIIGYNEYVEYIAGMLQKQNLKVSMTLPVNDSSGLEQMLHNLLSIIEQYKTIENKVVVLIIGPPNIDKIIDEKLRNKVEYEFRSKGIFCWYLSTRLSSGESSTMRIKSILSHKLYTILKELVIKLNIPSHTLLPFELMKGNQIKYVIGIDATTYELSKGSLRIAATILIFNPVTGSYTIDVTPHITASGEDHAIAETFRNILLNKNYEGPILIFVNRAKPTTILSYLTPKENAKLLDQAIIIGATKTHNLSRILKEGNNGLANPELLSYYPLYENRDINIADCNVKVSKYLAITTTATAKWIPEYTVKPILFTILIGEKYKEDQYLTRKILYYSMTQCLLNNTTMTWLHSLPWPLHRIDKMLKTAKRIAPDMDKLLEMIYNANVREVL
ncbi:MAG: hypothetical protein RQ968_03965 [Thermoproteota archaeon]|jgi:hypothetical protein|nr:hypothetical protein [Thermoproteota archaeon]